MYLHVTVSCDYVDVTYGYVQNARIGSGRLTRFICKSVYDGS